MGVLWGNGDEGGLWNKEYKEKYRCDSFKVEYVMLYDLYFSCFKFCKVVVKVVFSCFICLYFIWKDKKCFVMNVVLG